jgi:hypothetical protein
VPRSATKGILNSVRKLGLQQRSVIVSHQEQPAMGRKVWSQRDRRHRSAVRLTDAGRVSACEYRRSGCGREEEKAQITLVGIAPPFQHSIDFIANRSARLVAIVAIRS